MSITCSFAALQGENENGGYAMRQKITMDKGTPFQGALDFSYLQDLGFEIIREKTYKTNKHLFIEKAGKEEVC